VKLVAQNFDPSLRCALPVREPLNQSFPLPALPEHAAVLAADGSQINPDRHAEVDYCLINVGAIQMRYGSTEPPATTVSCHLFYDEELCHPLRRSPRPGWRSCDSSEREMLASLAEGSPPL
jgi:hypothetical protein